MFGNKLGLDFLLSVKILRPTIGSWQVVEDGKTWADFAEGDATAMRRIRVGWRGRRCWIVAYRDEVDALAALVAWGARRAARRNMYTAFTFYAVDPRREDGFKFSSTLGSGFTIPRRLPQAYASAQSQRA